MVLDGFGLALHVGAFLLAFFEPRLDFRFRFRLPLFQVFFPLPGMSFNLLGFFLHRLASGGQLLLPIVELLLLLFQVALLRLQGFLELLQFSFFVREGLLELRVRSAAGRFLVGRWGNGRHARRLLRLRDERGRNIDLKAERPHLQDVGVV